MKLTSADIDNFLAGSAPAPSDSLIAPPPPEDGKYTVEHWDPLLDQLATRHPTVSKELVRSIIQQESGGDPGIDGVPTDYGAAKGLGQFIDSTAKQYIPGWRGPEDSYDPVKNATGIYRYMEDLLAKHKGDKRAALNDYFGHGTDPTGKKDSDYIEEVMSRIPADDADIDAFLAETASPPAPPAETPSLMDALYPNSAKAAARGESGKELAGASIADAGSFLGRLASAVMNTGVGRTADPKKTFLENVGALYDEFKTELSKTKSTDTDQVAAAVENFLRDPGTIPSLVIGGPGGATIRAGIAAGARAGVTSAVEHTAERVGAGEEANIPSAVAETALSAGLGGAGPLTKGIVKKIIDAPDKVSDRIMSAHLKPPLKIYRDGFDIKNIEKYDLFGDTREIAEKSQVEISSRMTQIKNELATAGSTGKKIDLANVALDAVQEIESNRAKFPKLFSGKLGAKTPFENATEEIVGLMARLARGADADPLLANEIKQGLGEIAASAFGKGTKEDEALEAVAMVTYGKLREAIEKSSPANIKQLNKEISELIPIKMAAVRRVPIEERQELLSLKDAAVAASALASGSPAPLAFKLGDFLLKNPKFAKVLKKVGKIAPVAKATGSKAYKVVTPGASAAVRSALFRELPDDED